MFHEYPSPPMTPTAKAYFGMTRPDPSRALRPGFRNPPNTRTKAQKKKK